MSSTNRSTGLMTGLGNSSGSGGFGEREMSDNLSETESDTSSVMGDASAMDPAMKPPSPASREQLSKRIESLLQENRVLKVELETYKLRVKTLQEENKGLKQASVLIQAKAEVEEEFISNTLLKKIQELKKEKEVLALNYEQEEECLTNDLSRKLNRLRQEKATLAQTLQQEQESLVNKLMRKIRKLESETFSKQTTLDQLRREKVELENTLEQEQEALVNRLWKRMDKLETEKRYLQEKLEQPISAPPSPMDVSNEGGSGGAAALAPPPAQVLPPPPAATDPSTLVRHIQYLRAEVARLKQSLKNAQNENLEKMGRYVREEQHGREENLRLRRKLEMEVERRQELCRHLSESESSLEMEDERHFNELSSHGGIPPPPASSAAAVVASAAPNRRGTISNPIPRPVSPALGGLNVNVTMGGVGVVNPPSPMPHRCPTCGTLLQTPHLGGSFSTPACSQNQRGKLGERLSGSGEKFARPANPPTPKAQSPSPSSIADSQTPEKAKDTQ